MTQPTDIRAALTEPVGEGPSAEAIAEMAEDLRWKRLPWAQGTGDSFLLDLALTVLARWGRPAAPAAPEVGDVGELIQCLRIRAASLGAEGADLSQQGDAAYFTRAADSLEQFSAPAPAVVPAGEAEEMAEWLRQRCGLMNPRHEGYEIDMMTRAATLLQQQAAPAPAVVPAGPPGCAGSRGGVADGAGGGGGGVVSTPTIRDALKWLVELDNSSLMQDGQWAIKHENAIADAIEALAAEPVGEGASERIVSIAKAVQECAFAHESDARLIGNVCAEDVADLCDAVIDRWGHPAALPAPKPGEVGELIQCLQIRAASLGAEGANLRQRGDAVYFTRAATLLQQQAAPAPAVVPVAVEALTRLYWWGGMREDVGYSSDVVLGVRDWIDGGMVGGLPQLPRWIADRCPPLPQGGEGES